MNRKEITDASENINTEQDGNTAVGKATITLPLGPWMVPMFVVLALITGVAVALAVRANEAAEKAERETRMLEYYVMELDGKLMASGVIEPNRSWSAQKRGEKK